MSICHSSRFSCLAKEMPGGRWPCICVQYPWSVSWCLMAGLGDVVVWMVWHGMDWIMMMMVMVRRRKGALFVKYREYMPGYRGGYYIP